MPRKRQKKNQKQKQKQKKKKKKKKERGALGEVLDMEKDNLNVVLALQRIPVSQDVPKKRAATSLSTE